MENKFTEFKITQRYGMEGVGDCEHEYLSEKEIKESFERRSAYIQDCKLKGIYGKEYTQILKVQHDPMYDEPRKEGPVCQSYRMDILKF